MRRNEFVDDKTPRPKPAGLDDVAVVRQSIEQRGGNLGVATLCVDENK